MKAEYLYHSGTDLDVVNAAKVSFNKVSDHIVKYNVNTKKDELVLTEKDINLINYLARGLPSKEYNELVNNLSNLAYQKEDVEKILDALNHTATHWVPFTHNSITLRMTAPVPIRVHCFKHKVGFTESEESRRYISSRPVLHIPEVFHNRPANVKQGSSEEVNADSSYFKKQYIEICTKAIDMYEIMVNDGVAPEEARYILPQGVEVNWIWTGNLAAYARYYNQRSDSHAQGDSQILAQEVRKIIEPLFPVSWKALTRKD